MTLALKPDSFFSRSLFWFLFLIAVLNFTKLLHTPFTPDQPSDFRTLYMGQKLLATGQDPYKDATLKTVWKKLVSDEKLVSQNAPGFPETPLVYPPWALALFLPFSVIPYTLAYLIWYGLNLLFLGGMLYQIRKFCLEFSKKTPSLIELLVLALAFKSTVPALLVGQPLFLCLFLGFLALNTLRKNQLLAGLLLGLCAFKITLALPFIAFFLYRKAWKAILTAAFTGLVLILLALKYSPDGLTLLQSYQAIIAQTRHTIFQAENIETSYFLPLLTETGVLLARFYPKTANALTILYLAIGGFTIMWLWQLQKKQALNPLYIFCVLALLTLVTTYHLLYDCLILLPLTVCFADNKVKIQLLLLGICSVFFLPINGFVQALNLADHFPILLFTTPIAVLLMLLLLLKYPTFQDSETK